MTTGRMIPEIYHRLEELSDEGYVEIVGGLTQNVDYTS